MKKTIHSTCFILFLFCSLNFLSQNFITAVSMGGSTFDGGQAVKTDAAGNIYATGVFRATADFDPGPGVFNLNTGIGNEAYITKLNPSGNLIWARQVGGSSNSDAGNDIAVDGTGNVYVTGYFNATANFDPLGFYTVTATGSASDIYVLKLTPSGTFAWVVTFGNNNYEDSFGITTDASGNILVTGRFDGVVDFDPGPGVVNLTSVAGNDIFVIKLNPAGNLIWARQFGGTGGETSCDIATDNAGNVYTTGYFTSTPDFDPGPGTFTLSTNAVIDDIFVSKLDASGNFVWAKQMGSWNDGDNGFGIDVDPEGNVYTTGYFYTTSTPADFDPGPGTFTMNSAGSSDVFMSKLDPSGNFIWAKKIGSSLQDYCFGLDVDVMGNLHIAGYVQGGLDFDPSPASYILFGMGNYDAYAAKYDTDGNFIYAGFVGSSASEYAHNIALNPSGQMHVIGDYYSTGDFNPDAGVFNLTSNGQTDAFITKLSGCLSAPATNSISGLTTVCAGATQIYSVSAGSATSFTWNLPSGWSGTSTINSISSIVGVSGTISVTASNACGTGLTRTLSINVNPSPTVNAVTSNTLICAGQTSTLTASGASTYSWNPSGTTPSIIVSPTVTSSYTVTGTAGGCSKSAVITQSVSACTGISNLNTPPVGILIYPNPNNGSFNLQSDIGDGELSVHNIVGQKVFSQKIKLGENEIKTQGLSKGLYHYSILQNKTQVQTGKIVIE